ncbi:MAG TPA: indolepyruvate ferredoxin oxidoreductase subunit alpha [Burkholderiaceae bacterium]|nr:indolepyruvate ferredoxin oxidoreductase subunit alpha [Burkholderiaceae bacterium]
MEKSFKKEVELLRLGKGQVFHGEGILAVTKALLQSGVSYVSGYQGAPVSHLLDVMGDASDILTELGVHFEVAGNEAGAAAMLAASINYPVRGAVTWKSIVGTNVASDALSNVASAGVKGGALIVLGEDYGEGSSVIQERSHAIAMKSQIWLLDPRPNLQSIVDIVEKGFQLSEASNTPVMLELRIRACHVHGSFVCKDNRAPKFSGKNQLKNPLFNFGVIPLPPSNYTQEKHKVASRLPAAVKFIREQGLNEIFEGSIREAGIILQGGLYNTVIRSLQQLGLADAFGVSSVPLYVLNVTYPLIPEEVTRFCNGKRAVLVVEEGQPNFIEEAINSMLRRADINDTYVIGKEVLPAAGEYTGEAVLKGLTEFLQLCVPDGVDHWQVAQVRNKLTEAQKQSAEMQAAQLVQPRPPGFCTGCPERPVFSALKLVEKEVGKIHVSADIGCHTFSTLAPFSLGNTVVGYGLGLAGSAGVAPLFGKRTVSIMGDGGFWHQGLTTGIANAVFRNDDSVLVIMKNGYASATGAQQIASTYTGDSQASTEINMHAVLQSMGVKWIRTVRTFEVGVMMGVMREALDTPEKGLKIIIAEGECQLERQRRVRVEDALKLAQQQTTMRTRFGVDEDICTGDRSCMRLSGCPSLTLKENPDPLCTDPVTTVDNSCVGCGTCGEVAHAATLCPSFYKAEIKRNASWLDRLLDRVRSGIIGRLQGETQSETPGETA